MLVMCCKLLLLSELHCYVLYVADSIVSVVCCAGIGSFTIVDGHKVQGEDVGNK